MAATTPITPTDPITPIHTRTIRAALDAVLQSHSVPEILANSISASLAKLVRYLDTIKNPTILPQTLAAIQRTGREIKSLYDELIKGNYFSSSYDHQSFPNYMYSVYDRGIPQLSRIAARTDESISINPGLALFAALAWVGFIKADTAGGLRNQDSGEDVARQIRGVVERMANLVERRNVREPGWVMIPYRP